MAILVWFMVFNATFNNFSAISWRSDLLVEETVVPRAPFEVDMEAKRLSWVIRFSWKFVMEKFKSSILS